MSVSVRIPTILRTYTGGESEVSADGGTLAEVLDSLDAQLPRDQGADPRRPGRDPPVRQRVRRQRRRALPRGARHQRPPRARRSRSSPPSPAASLTASPRPGGSGRTQSVLPAAPQSAHFLIALGVPPGRAGPSSAPAARREVVPAPACLRPARVGWPRAGARPGDACAPGPWSSILAPILALCPARSARRLGGCRPGAHGADFIGRLDRASTGSPATSRTPTATAADQPGPHGLSVRPIRISGSGHGRDARQRTASTATRCSTRPAAAQGDARDPAPRRPRRCPVTCGVDDAGRVVVSTYPQRAEGRQRPLATRRSRS